MQHALKMYEHIEGLDQLGYWMNFELSVDLILERLPNSFAQFVLDHGIDHIISTIPELIDVLKITKGKMVEKKDKDCLERDLLLLWTSWPLEEELQGLLGVQEEGGM